MSLPALYKAALNKAAKASSLPAVDDETQDLVEASLSDLHYLTLQVDSLSLFSPNEVLDDISTRDLVYLSLPFIHAEVQNRVRTTDEQGRILTLAHVQHLLHAYISNLEIYNIVPTTERVLYTQQPSSIRDAATRREVRIKQYKAEKDLRTRIEIVRRQSGPVDYSLSFELVASLLPSSEHDAEDLENETALREATLLLLRLFYGQACAQLESVAQENQLLRNAPSLQPPVDERRGKTKEQDMWKIDAVPRLYDTGPLLDPRGKPLQPFTILPASAPDRSRLQTQVFGPGHRLPTMTIDEYLEIERQRGGILPTRGSHPEAKPSSSKQVTIDSEMDGRVLGELKAEENRLEDERWAQYKETHPRGAGNTMNRG